MIPPTTHGQAPWFGKNGATTDGATTPRASQGCSQNDRDARDMHQPKVVLGFSFPSCRHSAKFLQPRKQVLNLPSASVSPQRPPVLFSSVVAAAFWRDQLDAPLVSKARGRGGLYALPRERVNRSPTISEPCRRSIAEQGMVQTPRPRLVRQEQRHVESPPPDLCLAATHLYWLWP